MRKLLVLAVLLIVVASMVYGQGCSQCKMLAEQGSELDENSFGTNINTGILYLMAFPYLILMFLFRHRIIAFFKKKKEVN
jgi:hypothetical protein